MPPLLQAPGEAPQFLWDGRSAPLGSRAGRTARVEHRTVLAPGSRLLLYTDGLVERRDRPIDEGLRWLSTELAGRRESPLPGLAAALAGTLVGGDHADDVCLICVALGAEERLDRTIPADAVRIADLRQDLRGWLASHGVDEETRQAVLLACSEAVANAIEHGYRGDTSGIVVVSATMSSDAVEVRVSDQGSWRPATTDVARGRGLQLIRQVMDQVVIEKGAGTTVTMRRLQQGTLR
jgi:serine/threonine-protein kinase RsbW